MIVKSIMTKIYKPVKAIFIARKNNKSRQKMMRAYLKIKGHKFCAIYNNKGLHYE